MPNFLERSIAFIAPGIALKRAAAKHVLEHQFGYADHPERRGDSGGMGRNGSGETSAKHRDRIKAMWDAREQVEHDGLLGGALGRIVLYVVGQLSCKATTSNPAYNKLVDDYFHNWSGDERDDDGYIPCDTSGRHRLRKMLALAFVGMFTDGDHGHQWIPGDENTLPSLLPIEADRIGSPVEGQANTKTYVSGFTLDPETGKITLARVFKRTETNQYTDPVEVPHSNFFHLWDSQRGDHYRGRSHFLRSLNSNRDLRETMEAESLAIKEQSQYAIATTSRNPYDTRNGAAYGKGPDGKDTKPTANGTRTKGAEWAKVLTMVEGESMSMLAPAARPSGATLALWQVKIRMMALDFGVSYGFLWDLATLGGVTARIEVRSDERRIMYWQQLLVDCILRRARRLLLDHGVAYGLIPPHPEMHQCAWHFGQRIITDAGYEVQNDILLLNNGLVAADDVATKYNDGANLHDVMSRNAGAVKDAQGVATENQVPIEMFARALWPDGTQQLAAMATPPEELQPPPPGSLQAVGEKGAKQIFDILESAAAGTLPREEAINTLITIYGLTDAQAKAIVPDKQKQPEEKEPAGSAKD